MLSQIVASQFFALFVDDESDDTAAGSMISETEVCVARISPASSRDSHGQFSSLSAKIFHFVSCNPNLFCTTDVNKRIWRHFSPKTLYTRGANDDLCLNEFCTNVDLCRTILSQGSHQKLVQLCVWTRHEFDTLRAPMALHSNSATRFSLRHDILSQSECVGSQVTNARQAWVVQCKLRPRLKATQH